MRKLTIGMATHDDYDGVYFTIQNLRLNNPEIINDIEFVIVDNNPTGKHGQSVRKLIDWIKEPVQYLPYVNQLTTAVRNKIFSLADTPYVLCLDSHVLIQYGSLKKLVDFYDSGADGGNLIQGPLLYDDMQSYATHFNLTWGSYMWGQWGTDERGKHLNGEPFEIPAQGLGLFSCRKDSWLGFNQHFKGFGGEEGYIHEKFRKHGKKTLCLPFLRWLHRFDRPNGISYPNNLKDRFRNYLIGFKELGLDTTELKAQFKSIVSEEEIKELESHFGVNGEWIESETINP